MSPAHGNGRQRAGFGSGSSTLCHCQNRCQSLQQLPWGGRGELARVGFPVGESVLVRLWGRIDDGLSVLASAIMAMDAENEELDPR